MRVSGINNDVDAAEVSQEGTDDDGASVEASGGFSGESAEDVRRLGGRGCTQIGVGLWRRRRR